MVEVNGITHISLSVVDLDRSAAFYRNVLGLVTLVERFETEHYDEVILGIPGRGRLALCLQCHRDNDGSEFDPRTTGLDHLALAVADVPSLDAWAARLDELEIEHSGVVPNRGFGHLIAFRDPDGIQLELHAMV